MVMLVNLATASRQGAMLGSRLTVNFIAMATATLLVGSLATTIGYGGTFLTVTLIPLAAARLVMHRARKPEAHAHPSESPLHGLTPGAARSTASCAIDARRRLARGGAGGAYGVPSYGVGRRQPLRTVRRTPTTVGTATTTCM
ncbi:MAG: hypothetical protein RI554_07230, partial [Trueperaceae bacterium]|nr:hypothetical protein [Trueperaceae bacterium]